MVSTRRKLPAVKHLETAKTSTRLADPNLRVLAGIIDTIMVFFPVVTLVLPVLMYELFTSSYPKNLRLYNFIYPSNNIQYSIIIGIILLLIFLCYFVIIPAKILKGQTIGKRLLHLKVVRENTKNIATGNLLIRYSPIFVLCILISLPILFDILLISLFIIILYNLFSLYTDTKHQTLLDKLGQTIVIENTV